MNPAALKANVRDLAPGSTLLINVDTFDTRNLDKAGYAQNPLRDELARRLTASTRCR